MHTRYLTGIVYRNILTYSHSYGIHPMKCSKRLSSSEFMRSARFTKQFQRLSKDDPRLIRQIQYLFRFPPAHPALRMKQIQGTPGSVNSGDLRIYGSRDNFVAQHRSPRSGAQALLRAVSATQPVVTGVRFSDDRVIFALSSNGELSFPLAPR